MEGWDGHGGGSRTSPTAWFLVIEILWADVNMMAHIHLRKKSNTDHSSVLSKQDLIEVNFTCHPGRALAVWQVWQLPYQYFGILPHQNSFYKLIFNQIGKAQRSVAGDL